LSIQYCTANNPSQLSLYINGVKSQTVPFTSTNSWSGTYALKTVSVTIPAGATVKLQLDSGDAGANIDYIAVSGSSGGGSTTKYEAENGTIAGGATVANDGAASGGKAIQNLHIAGSSVQINNVAGATGGNATLHIIFATNDGSAQVELFVNGVSRGLVSTPSTAGWSNYTGNVQVTIPLNSGTGNTIKLVGGHSGVNVDYISVTTP